MNALITIEDNTPLTTSYKVAEALGIKHKSEMQLIKDHKAQIEKHFGVLRFENAKPLPGSSGGRPEQYAVLTENQANYVLMLSGNTEKSMEVKALFVKAFAEAKEALASRRTEQKRLPQFNFKYQERLSLNKNVRVYGYIPATKFLDDINIQFLEDVIVLSETSSPDISIGKFLAKRLPSEPWYDASVVRKPVGGTDRSKWDQDIIMTVYVTDDGYPVKREVTHFPIEWYAPIWHIIQTEYFPDLFPKYLAGKHNGIIRCGDEKLRKYIAERVNYFSDEDHK